MLNCAEANEHYREGRDFPISDAEYDHMLSQIQDEEFKELVGTQMTLDKTLEAMHALRSAEGWDQRYPTAPYRQHPEVKFQLWDADIKRMDDDVVVMGNHLLIRGDADDVAKYNEGSLDWSTSELAVIEGAPYFRMPLDNMLFLRRYTTLQCEGKEIYDGDLLKTPDGEIVRVMYDRTMHCWAVTDRPIEDENYTHSRPLFLVAPVSTHVGNIYQNPEKFKGTTV